jgi:hypothetical protein
VLDDLDKLASTRGLEALAAVGGDVVIASNQALASLAGMQVRGRICRGSSADLDRWDLGGGPRGGAF